MPAVSPKRIEAPVERASVAAYTIPTQSPESDGTLEWDSTTLVTVEVAAGGMTGFGHTYAAAASASLIQDVFVDLIRGRDAFAISDAWRAMVAAVRNTGRPGIASTAISAVDSALWDLKARLLNLPLVTLLGAVRTAVPVYASGGFTSYSVPELQRQLSGWVESGIGRVKMKVGREPHADVSRVRAAREAIGVAELFVDANGAYSRKQAQGFANLFAEFQVSWFEEPVSSDDLEGLRLLRDTAPPGMEITAGEYGYDVWYFRQMLQAGAVDVLQADATRCLGITGFMQAAALCDAFHVPLSAHTAPSLHAHVCCALPAVRHVEYFHDHARIEQMLFDGALQPARGELRPDVSRSGMGVEFKRRDAERFQIPV